MGKSLSRVGEFLKQIESFNGIIVVATNLKEFVDHAFLRRFLFHLKFDYPQLKERVALLERFLKQTFDEAALLLLAEVYEFSPGEIRNAVYRWMYSEDQSLGSLEFHVEEQVSLRTLTQDRTISII